MNGSTMEAGKSNGPATASWALGLAACLCNVTIVLAPVGIILGIVSLILGLVSSAQRRGSGAGGLLLSGVSFLIAFIWIASVASLFVFDPTLL